jgi:hypothetical protein
MDSDEKKTVKSNRRKLLLAGAMSPVVMGMPLRASAHAIACAQRGRRAACGRSRPARRRNGAARAE